MKEEELCSQLFCGKAIHWVIGWCQRWRLYGNNFWYCSCYPKGFHLVIFKLANKHFLNCFMPYLLRIRIKNRQRRDFPSGQWLRIFLPVQWTWVWSLVQELRFPHALGPINCNYRAHLVHLPKPVWAFSHCGEWGLLSSCSGHASGFAGFSFCRAEALEHTGFGRCTKWAL